LTGPELSNGVAFADVPDGGMLLGPMSGEAVLLARRGDEVFAAATSCTYYCGAQIFDHARLARANPRGCNPPGTDLPQTTRGAPMRCLEVDGGHWLAYTAELCDSFSAGVWITVERTPGDDRIKEHYSVFKRLMIGGHKL
jgi:hypothetical protein